MVKGKRKVLKEIPLLPLRGVLVFPHTATHLDVGRVKSIKAINAASAKESLIFLAMQEDAQTEDPTEKDIYKKGTVAEIKQVLQLPGEAIRVVVEGLYRAEIKKFLKDEPYFEVQIKEFKEENEKEEIDPTEADALRRVALELFEQYAQSSRKIPPEALISIASLEDSSQMADIMASYLNLKLEERQKLLEETGSYQRLQMLVEFLSQEIKILELEQKISSEVREQIETSQKEYYLREQLKAIQKELGEGEEKEEEIEELRRKVAESNMPQEVREKALKEIKRMEKMPPMVAEITVVRNYLDWLIELPWNKFTEDHLDIKEAAKILDEDHYGLKDVKERILEYLAIRQLSKEIKGPIICFVGPPGVGKTSLAKSIARALNRSFVRISLGGIRDEAEIRGHRRTYVGALPGRIIQGMRQAGTANPVFLLDEIDKLGTDFRGDPTSALLEVLDPEQNFMFSDHYIEVPFDLSQVMFITTANITYSIPRPLLDRMEVIELPGYTDEEKMEIAVRHLWPKKLKEHGLTEEQLKITRTVIRRIVNEYTREAGVRNLERELATICRKSARQIVEGAAVPLKIDARNLEKYLGAPRFHYGKMEEENEVGVTTGLAVTEAGGDILKIEAIITGGKGNLILTGHLGDVMKESAQAGITYIRSRSDALKIPPNFYRLNDIHIHIPEGAIPKDGPSAGVAMAVAVISALTKKPVRKDIAMTGEITLRGRVLAVGGIKEKVLAAYRSGIKKVILPAENKKNIEDIPLRIKDKIEFIFVRNMDEVLPLVIVDSEKKE